MNHLSRTLSAAVLVAVSGAVLAQAVAPGKAASQADATRAIEARQAIFKQIRELNDPLGAMLRPNGPALDTTLVATNAAKIAELAAGIPAAYQVDTRGFTATKTRALEGIWSSEADFKSKADGLAMVANTVAAAARTGNAEETRRAMMGMGRACGACHDPYRAPE